MSYLKPIATSAAALVLSFSFATAYAAENLHSGLGTDNLRADIQDVFTKYEAAANSLNIPALLTYFSQEGTYLPQASLPLEDHVGTNYGAVLGSFGGVFANMAAAGYPPGTFHIYHDINRINDAGNVVYVRATLHVASNADNSELDTFNCTFEFIKRQSTSVAGDTKYVVDYIQFASVNVESKAFGTVAAP